ncbi:MAG: DEAD/DEAH box helicase [Bdellovibrionales bacterium]|nr:DEAD/DEAH box helicase [Bdellovibrionales bacterium]
MTRSAKHIRELRDALLSGIGVPEAKQFSADAFQLDAIRSLEEEKDTLVIAPTGAGKTYIAVEAIRRTVLAGKRAVYTAPLKALSNAKYLEFKRTFEPEFRVGLLTGDRKIEGDAHIVVATTEIYRNELYSYQENYSLVVLDEFHYLSDPQRGPVWEESVIVSPRSATLLMLSASISNAEQVADWIRETRAKEVEIISVGKRPVELRLAFLHPDLGIVPLTDNNGKLLKEVSTFYGGGRGNNRGNRRRGQGGGRGRRQGRKR